MDCVSCKKTCTEKTESTILCHRCLNTALGEYRHGFIITTDLCRLASAKEISLFDDNKLVGFVKADFKALNQEIAEINIFLAANCSWYNQYDFDRTFYEYEDTKCALQIFKTKLGFSVSISLKEKPGEFLSHEVKRDQKHWFTLTRLRASIESCHVMFQLLKTVSWWKACET